MIDDEKKYGVDSKLCAQKIEEIWTVLDGIDNGTSLNILTCCLSGLLSTMPGWIRSEAKQYMMECLDNEQKATQETTEENGS